MNKPRRRPTASAVQSPLETYLHEINETQLLAAEDEQDLAVAIGEGDIQAAIAWSALTCGWCHIARG